jgi:hypothetical protein
MTVISRAAQRVRRSVAAACALAALTAGETRSQQFTLDQLSRAGGVASADFPLVLGARTLRARFQEKRSLTMADGSRQTLYIHRVFNCWLKERTAAERAVVDCRGHVGPGVFIPVLMVTPASRQTPERSPVPDLVLTSRSRNSLADFVPELVLDTQYGPAKAVWIGLGSPAADSLALSAPAVPAALVFCVPASSSECQSSSNVTLANIAGTPDQAVAVQPAPPAPPPPPPPPPVVRLPPAPVAPPPARLPPRQAAPAPPTPPAPPASGGSIAQATPVTPPPPAGDSPAATPSPPPPLPAQLHYVIRPAAGGMPADWNAARMAKRLVALLASTESKFYLKARDGVEVPSSFTPELTGSGDAVVVWSGDNPPGATEFVFRGVEGLELLPWTQPAESQPTSASLASPRIRASDYISSAEYRIAAPFLYDQWQAGIEVVTRVYGREQPYAFSDTCRFSLLIPRTGWISFLTGPVTVGLERTDQGGKSVLVSPPNIMPAQLTRAQGEPLLLDVQAANSGQACSNDRAALSSFPTAITGNQIAGWRLSSVPGSNPSTGRMDLLTASLPVPGRWLLGLYGPQNIGAGTEAGSNTAADAQDQIFNAMTSFLDDLRERHFQGAQPASTAIGADLALVSAADAVSQDFSEKSVVTGKFRQPPPQNGLFRLDPEGNRRLSAFLSSPGNTGTEVSFRSVGQMIRRYSDLFGNFSGPRPPVAVYVGAVRPGPGTCAEWKRMTADTAKLPGRPRVFAVVFANAAAEAIAQQLGQNGYNGEEFLGGPTRALTCDGDSGSMLMVVPFPDLMLRTPEAIMRPAFETVERWTLKVQN